MIGRGSVHSCLYVRVCHRLISGDRKCLSSLSESFVAGKSNQAHLWYNDQPETPRI